MQEEAEAFGNSLSKGGAASEPLQLQAGGHRASLTDVN